MASATAPQMASTTSEMMMHVFRLGLSGRALFVLAPPGLEGGSA